MQNTKLDDLVTKVGDYVTSYLRNNLSEKLSFHNLSHTYEVIDAVKEIGKYCKLSQTQLAIVTVAAWFHDCGYANAYKGHEDESMKLANDFLKKQFCNSEFIDSVLSCIEATRYPQKPRTLEEMVICDADLYHFTRPDYPAYEGALRSELYSYLQLGHSQDEWNEKNCQMLITHKYFTNYGQQVLQKFKEVNLERMKCN